MKVRVLRNLGEGWPALKEGETADVADKIGEALVSQCLAEVVPIEAVPPPPIVAIPTPKPEPEPAQQPKAPARKHKEK